MARPEQEHPLPPRPRLGSLLLLVGVALLGAALVLAVVGLGWPRTGSAGASAPPPDLVRLALATPLAPHAQVIPTPGGSAPTPPPLLTPPATVQPTASATSSTPSPARPTSTPSPRPAAIPANPPAAQQSPTPPPRPSLPHATHIAIPAVGISTNVVEVGHQTLEIDNQSVAQWQVADYAAGHAALSANPGEGGNIVIAGHDDWKGQVFKNLYQARLGDQVILATPTKTYHYTITEIHYRKEAGAPLTERLAAGQFLAPMPEERVTLVTCWPYGVDNYRLIVVAKPQG